MADENQIDADVLYSNTTRTKTPELDWTELHQDLLESILKRLPFVDIIRFKSVCSSWCQAANSYTSAPNYQPWLQPQAPWLLFPTGIEHDEDTARFFSITEKRIYTFKNLFRGHGCVLGSSHGWFVMSERRISKLELYLLNPISRVRIQLHSLSDLLDHRGHYDIHNYPVRIVVSSDPSRNNSFYVVANYYLDCFVYGLAFYKHNGAGDETCTWTEIAQEKTTTYPYDMIFHNDHLFASSVEHRSIQVWDFQGGSPIRTVNCLLPMGASFDMAESQGEPLFLGDVDNDGDFIIYKLDSGANKLDKVECLQDRAFVSIEASTMTSAPAISLSTRDFPELEANSIYSVSDESSYYENGDFNSYSSSIGRDGCVDDIEVVFYNFESECPKPYYKVRVDRRLNQNSEYLLLIVPDM